MNTVITSTQNQRIKQRAKLLTKKGRTTDHLFIVEGKHLIQEALDAGVLVEVYQLEDLPPFDAPTYVCTQTVLNKLSSQKSDAKYIGICHMHTPSSKHHNKIILLDEVQDPGNVGTIIRSAYSFGYDHIYLSHNCADIYNPKTIQASQGALFHIPCTTADLSTVIEECHNKQIQVYATALHQEHKKLASIVPPKQFALLFGNEGQGIRDAYVQQADECVLIEMEHFESLNVAMAASIMMYTLAYKK